VELKNPALCRRSFVFQGACGRRKYDYPGWFDIAFAVGAWKSCRADAQNARRWASDVPTRRRVLFRKFNDLVQVRHALSEPDHAVDAMTVAAPDRA
jgi:hypothetical protein